MESRYSSDDDDDAVDTSEIVLQLVSDTSRNITIVMKDLLLEGPSTLRNIVGHLTISCPTFADKLPRQDQVHLVESLLNELREVVKVSEHAVDGLETRPKLKDDPLSTAVLEELITEDRGSHCVRTLQDFLHERPAYPWLTIISVRHSWNQPRECNAKDEILVQEIIARYYRHFRSPHTPQRFKSSTELQTMLDTEDILWTPFISPHRSSRHIPILATDPEDRRLYEILLEFNRHAANANQIYSVDFVMLGYDPLTTEEAFFARLTFSNLRFRLTYGIKEGRDPISGLGVLESGAQITWHAIEFDMLRELLQGQEQAPDSVQTSEACHRYHAIVFLLILALIHGWKLSASAIAASGIDPGANAPIQRGLNVAASTRLAGTYSRTVPRMPTPSGRTRCMPPTNTGASICRVKHCGRVFEEANELAIHECMHRGAALYRCRVPGCEETFPSSHTRGLHESGHMAKHGRVARATSLLLRVV